jgi:hypothetical protein
MEAEVVGGGDALVGAIKDEALVEEGGGDGGVLDLAGDGDGVPVIGEDAPVAFGEGAVAREGAVVGRGGGKFRGGVGRGERGVHGQEV